MTYALLLLAAAPSADEPVPVEFNRDVRPILSQNCFPCHGPDDDARQAELRLDQARVLEDERGILVPGSPRSSELIRRITAQDAGERMPPADSKRRLTPEQIDVLRRWVEQGAQYQEHWSFRPIRRPAPPDVGHTDWPINPIDRFVLAALEARGLEPSPQADGRTLVRRLSLDLSGTPPTREDVQTFLADSRTDAYERLVDRLLASRAYAERMTLAWMDAARYGDTSVYHADGPRDMWLWRDWVIEAYDSNLPFDRFTIDQLAGDLVPGATRGQLVASGFHRNNGTSDEGGAIDEELRVNYMVDRVKTTANVWLGLSMECAQCHEHKFDPIEQEDYYRFFAFFDQSREKGFQTRQGNEPPILRVPSPEQERQDTLLTSQIDAAQRELDGAEPPQAGILQWIEEQRAELLASVEPELGTWHVLGPFEAASGKEAFQTEYGPEHGPEHGIDLQAAVRGRAWEAKPDWTDGKVRSLGLPDNSAIYLARTIHAERALRRGVSLGSDDTIQVWLNGDLILAKEVYRGTAPDQEKLELDLRRGENQLLLKVCNGGGASGYYFDLLGLPLPDEVLAALRLQDCDRGVEHSRVLRDHYVRAVWPQGVERAAKLGGLRKERADLRQASPTVMVMEDLPGGRMTYVLERGQYDAPRKDRSVEPGVPEFLLPMPGYAPPNRLGLALWLTHPDHPLTARVAVNRYWAMIFGTGIVRTVMDLGSQGERPSHSRLLDWLASDFIASSWNVKHAVKQIVMSATYRQSSRMQAELRTADPQNRLLGRAPRYRLQGEFLRDQALAVSGLLVDQVGGPGVRPYQPAGLWNEVSLDKNVRFVQDHGDALYRKSMYIYWKRSAPMPVMTTFDAPTREKCVVQRQRTNTPLQALVLLNDVQFVEAARHLAERMMRGGDDFPSRLDVGFELCTARPADEQRRRIMRAVYERQLAVYGADPTSAGELLNVGESAGDASLDGAERAAWTVVASMLLNLDETLNRE